MNPIAQFLDALGESLPCANYDFAEGLIPEDEFLSRIGRTEISKDFKNYTSPNSVWEWQTLLDAVLLATAVALLPLSIRGDFEVLFFFFLK